MNRAVVATGMALGVLASTAAASPMPPGSAPAAARSAMRTGGTLPPRPVLAAMPDFAGIGPLRFGMDPAQMRRAWGLPLYGHAPAHDPQACWYLLPRKDDHGLMFMVEAGRFVRIDVATTDKTAPGGGRVGMTTAQIERLYAGRVTATPGKYDSDARVLSITPSHRRPPHGGRAKLVFDVDAAGRVDGWRIGMPPQVDFVEGCG